MTRTIVGRDALTRLIEIEIEDDVGVIDSGGDSGGGGGGSGVTLMSFPFAFDTPGLDGNGVSTAPDILIPIGAVVLDMWIDLTEVWNSTDATFNAYENDAGSVWDNDLDLADTSNQARGPLTSLMASGLLKSPTPIRLAPTLPYLVETFFQVYVFTSGPTPTAGACTLRALVVTP